MQNELFYPCLSYVLLMTFTPGPNNVSASALGLKAGYRGSLRFIMGMTTGFMIILSSGGLLTEFLTRNYHVISSWLKWIGAIYMAYLAISLFLDSPGKKGAATTARESYLGGLLLQFVNPKGILFGITVFSSFSSLLTGGTAKTLASAALLSFIGFTAVSAWALMGSTFSHLFARKAFRLGFNIVMALFLAWSALSIILH